jgi:hypothetical protein
MIARILPPDIAARLILAAEKARALRKDGLENTKEHKAQIERIDDITEYAKAMHPELFRADEGTTK